MITAFALLGGYAAGLFVGLLVLVALVSDEEPGRERVLNALAVALVLACGALVGILLAWSLTT